MHSTDTPQTLTLQLLHRHSTPSPSHSPLTPHSFPAWVFVQSGGRGARRAPGAQHHHRAHQGRGEPRQVPARTAARRLLGIRHASAPCWRDAPNAKIRPERRGGERDAACGPREARSALAPAPPAEWSAPSAQPCTGLERRRSGPHDRASRPRKRTSPRPRAGATRSASASASSTAWPTRRTSSSSRAGPSARRRRRPGKSRTQTRMARVTGASQTTRGRRSSPSWVSSCRRAPRTSCGCWRSTSSTPRSSRSTSERRTSQPSPRRCARAPRPPPAAAHGAPLEAPPPYPHCPTPHRPTPHRTTHTARPRARVR